MKNLYVLLFCFMLFQPLCAQWQSGAYMSWEEFLQEYVQSEENETDEAISADDLLWLENLANHPMQINRVDRSDLQQLPFLSEQQIDSLLVYRQQRKGLLSLGELQFITGFDYFTRRYLSLFVRCDSFMLSTTIRLPTPNPHTLKQLLTLGKHEIESRVDLPLYRRKGYRTPDKPTPTNYYVGNPLHHVVRYRYQYKREIAYGLTTDKDAGEPVAKQGFYPYDYWSAYFMLRPKHRPWSFVLGDYEVRGNRGLLFGRMFYGGREQILNEGRRNTLSFRPHTSTDESRFFRGAAAACQFSAFDFMAFASYRKLDARYNDTGDTVRSILQTGSHRTLSEITRRRNLGSFTFGGHIGYNRSAWGLSADGYLVRYDHPVWPEARFYNAGYFRGQTAGGASLSYYCNLPHFTVQGEAALDHRAHFATEHTLSYRLTRKASLNAQLRYFAPDFVSIYGDALQQSSRVANEQGLLFGFTCRPSSRWQLKGYADLFRYPSPTYTTVQGGAKGIELSLQSQWKTQGPWYLTARYRFKSRQRTITGYKQLEYRTTHRARVAALMQKRKFELNTQADFTYATRQTGKQSVGWMLSARTAWKPKSVYQLKAFASLFFTDDYESAVYAYEPQLYRAGAFPSFAHHGLRGVLVNNWKMFPSLTLGVRASLTYYFNRTSISSGIAEINSPCQSDISLQLRWQL